MASEIQHGVSAEHQQFRRAHVHRSSRREDITPEEAEGWLASGKRLKQIMAGKENGESAAITRQSRPKTRASFAKRVAASVTKAARMPIDMPKEDTKVIMRPRGGLNVARTEASIIMKKPKQTPSARTRRENITVVSTSDERRATLYSKVKALNIGDKTYEISAYRTAPDGTVKGVIRGIADSKYRTMSSTARYWSGAGFTANTLTCAGNAAGECKNKYKMPYVVKRRQWERKMEAMQQQSDPESLPPRRAPPAERPRGESKQRDSSRERDNSKRGRSGSCRRPSQSGERGTWADAVKANSTEKRQPPAQNAANKIQEENRVEKALRDENEKLKRKNR
ncbi:hypothetical protein HPB52_002978 [Rhipicephalus sanguineus]|uniref:Uncharacterized protein n=1 Tax=Rhipicephalus sanguineus TaxID=34632 RepID=A0A9D4QBS1_RHISA|nr:hypothetical protein HPB52_002978 [Rhipicephalus sanguineus]